MTTLKELNASRFNNSNSFKYLDVSNENGYRISALKKIFAVDSGKNLKILDLGCGDGRISRIFKEMGYDVYAVDVVDKYKDKIKNSGINFSKMDLSKKIEYTSGFFDYVFAGEIIEHIYDVKFFLDEINRVLKKKGVLVITTPNLAHLPDRFRLLFGKSPSQIAAIHEFLHLHIRHFTMNTLYECLVKTGFKFISLKSTLVVFLWSHDRAVLFSRMLAYIFPRFGYTLIVKAKKC